MSQTEIFVTSFICLIVMIFLRKCRALYVVSVKGHDTWKKGMALEKKGMVQRHAKTG